MVILDALEVCEMGMCPKNRGPPLANTIIPTLGSYRNPGRGILVLGRAARNTEPFWRVPVFEVYISGGT